MERPIRKPRTDERALWNVVTGITGLPAVLVAHHLKLFPLLAERARPLAEVSNALGIAPRPAEALLAVCAALGLVRRDGDRFALTPVAEDYLLESSPTYFGALLDVAMIGNAGLYSFESLKRAVLTNRSQVYAGEELFKSHEEQAALARAFTEMMHGHSMGAALAWPDALDLSRHRRMLDVGGGSGAHAIGATLRWPDLRATVYDIPPVCEVARETAARHEVADRVTTHVGDMWTDPFPAADLHFYADIYHDWPPEKGRFLTEKSFASLEPGGRIIVHEMLYDDDKIGPLATAGYAVAMLLWTEGQQYSAPELTKMLSDAGFQDVETKPTFGYWSIVTGTKP
jgi:protein-L-isoaspartate O-methyltransferase